ncbi:MAG: hypothetical protein AAF657_35895 [Acidobacteriota bacterium]
MERRALRLEQREAEWLTTPPALRGLTPAEAIHREREESARRLQEHQPDARVAALD